MSERPEWEDTPPPIPTENVVSLDDYRRLEDIVKRELQCEHVVFLGVSKDGLYPSYIPHEMLDIDLVYLIQILVDRRIARLE